MYLILPKTTEGVDDPGIIGSEMLLSLVIDGRIGSIKQMRSRAVCRDEDRTPEAFFQTGVPGQPLQYVEVALFALFT